MSKKNRSQPAPAPALPIANAPVAETHTKWHKNLHWWVAIWTAVLSLFAMGSFIYLKIQVNDADAMFEKDQRPYVYVAEKMLTTDVERLGSVVKVTLPMTNYGKSPAIITWAYFSTEFGPNAAGKLTAFPLREHNSVLPAGKIDYFDIPSIETVNDPETMRKIKETNGFVAIHGRVQYHSLDNHLYETDLCLYSQTAGPWSYCPGNKNQMKDCEQESCE
jgi:hypothetical protein